MGLGRPPKSPGQAGTDPANPSAGLSAARAPHGHSFPSHLAFSQSPGVDREPGLGGRPATEADLRAIYMPLARAALTPRPAPISANPAQRGHFGGGPGGSPGRVPGGAAPGHVSRLRDPCFLRTTRGLSWTANGTPPKRGPQSPPDSAGFCPSSRREGQVGEECRLGPGVTGQAPDGHPRAAVGCPPLQGRGLSSKHPHPTRATLGSQRPRRRGDAAPAVLTYSPVGSKPQWQQRPFSVPGLCSAASAAPPSPARSRVSGQPWTRDSDTPPTLPQGFPRTFSDRHRSPPQRRPESQIPSFPCPVSAITVPSHPNPHPAHTGRRDPAGAPQGPETETDPRSLSLLSPGL